MTSTPQVRFILKWGGGYFGKNKNKERKLIWAPQFSLQIYF
nr:MAG TPA: hypothetical protein [Caudoviricetes sp.]